MTAETQEASVHGGVRNPPSTALRLAVGIATRGRPHILQQTIQHIEHQTTLPNRIVVAYAEKGDIEEAATSFPAVTFVQAPLGLTRQRNAILDEVMEEDVVVFLDDDFLLERDYLTRMIDAFTRRPDMVVATGSLLADGINGPGLTFAEGRELLEAQAPPATEPAMSTKFNAYGCNMCLRLEPIRKYRLRFDENLPLYGWYEDVEFSRQLAKYGTVMGVGNAYGVHLGAKSGRQSGFRLGYSQVANPVYLAKKGSVPWKYAIASMTSRSGKNLVRSLAPEPYVDRRGRLRGNLRAWWHLLRGTLSPTHILHL